jgi:hypothetical protein
MSILIRKIKRGGNEEIKEITGNCLQQLPAQKVHFLVVGVHTYESIHTIF